LPGKQLIFCESKDFAPHDFHKVQAAAGGDDMFREIFSVIMVFSGSVWPAPAPGECAGGHAW
jgi:hypothetical protein